MIRHVITDIEGTTSSISFVKDVLFPYAREQLPAFIRDNRDNPELQQAMLDIRKETGSILSLDEVIEQLIEWIDQDKKITPLKYIQGMIWHDGYLKGNFKGHVYPDAVEYMQRWRESGIKLYIYSSGSVGAQKLIFGHSIAGDLNPLFSGYFDTMIGSKKEPDSYFAILNSIKAPAREVLFLSDVGEELDAAAAAGIQTCQLLRPEDNAVASAGHRQATDFSQVPVNQ